MDQAEKLRNIIKMQNKQQHLARVITVTSGKGGVGKSNISVNLAIQLSRLNKKVVILDADFGLANVDVMLGIRPKYNLADMMFGGKNIQDIICQGPENIGFISGGSGIKELADLDRNQISGIVNMMYELDSIADIIIIDTGAGISATVMDLVLSSNEVLLVTTPEPTSITDAYALLKTMCHNEDFNSSDIRIKLIANRTHGVRDGRELYDKLNSVADRFLNIDMDYLGAVPFDEYLTRAVMKQQPVSVSFPNAPSARAVLNIALALENGNDSGENKPKNGISGLFSRMFRKSGS